MSLDGNHRRFTPNAAISWTDNGGPALLFDHERGSYHSLNRWAADLWRMLQEGAHEGEIIAAFAARYDAEPEMIAADVADFLDSALASGLIALRS
jgi:PqqD family protein of HPr-rel-A system